MSYAVRPIYAIPPPPDPPELPPGVDPQPRWPWWYSLAGFGTAIGATLVLGLFVGIIGAAAGFDISDDPSPAVTLVLTILQDASLVGAAIFFASRTIRPRLWHFGLRRTRPWPAVGWAALGYAAFFLFVLIYSAIVPQEGEQSTVEDLGADEGTLALIGATFLVVVMAPFVEEFFFRGFFYRSLQRRLGVWWGATITALVFGAIHIGSTPAAALLILAALGFIFCIVFQITGSLYVTIALHAVQNTLAFSFAGDGFWVVALPMGGAVVLSCFLLPRFVGHGARPGGWRGLRTAS